MLTKKQLDGLLHIDTATGDLRWKVQPRGTVRIDDPNGCPVGCRHPNGRLVVTIQGKTYTAARLMWLHVKGEWPEGQIRCLDGDPSNIRPSNLALALTARGTAHPRVKAAKAQNQTPHLWDDEAGAYRVRGVSFDKGKNGWVARPTINGKRRFLGRFAAKEDAEAAVLSAFA